ncbi:MAG: hypothetical protein AAFR55_07945 [Pseudomonadota bacterium]
MMTMLALGDVRPVSAATTAGTPIVARHMAADRELANKRPRSELDQAVVEGWPVYRNARGQEVFNRARAVLSATTGTPPNAATFAKCAKLVCRLGLPRMTRDGWFPEGRIWVNPNAYVLFIKSPRPTRRGRFRLRPKSQMKVFVFHEFHNGTRNTDVYDTISSHRRSVFTPFYMSKVRRDRDGNRFVEVIQVAPHNVVSRHAANFRNRGGGIEVAKNYRDRLETLQAQAGILVATMITRREPQTRVVRHRGREGWPMLTAYMRRKRAVKAMARPQRVTLPFTRASAQRVTRATGTLTDLVLLPGAKPRRRTRVAARIPRRPQRPAATQPNFAAEPNRPPAQAPRTAPRVAIARVRTAPVIAALPLQVAPSPAPRLIAEPRLAAAPASAQIAATAIEPVNRAAADDANALSALIRRLLGQ